MHTLPKKEEKKHIEEAPYTKPVKVEDKPIKYEPPSDLQGKSLEELEAILDDHRRGASAPEKVEEPVQVRQQPKQAAKKVEKRPSMPMKGGAVMEKENMARK